jgi:cytochrome c peroxidase
MRNEIRRPTARLLAGVLCGGLGLIGLVAAAVRRDGGMAPPSAQNGMRAVVEADADSLDASLVALTATLRGDDSSAAAAEHFRAAYRASRASYKQLEAVAEFYAPAVAASLNSRRQEVDDDDAPPPSTLAPGGFPALDTLVWPSPTRANAARAREIVSKMHSPVQRLRQLAAVIVPTDAQLIELARLELARVSTLGIAGFDAQRTKDAMRESADALDGVRRLYARVGGARWPALYDERRALDSTWSRAAAYLRAYPDFERFDRLVFLAIYAEPAARALDAIRQSAHVVPVGMHRGWRSDVPSVYAAGAFNARAYAPSLAPVPTPELIALGRRLFADPRLSGTGTRSCASCHAIDHAFADGMAREPSLGGRGARVARNTPTLINAALQPTQFADERAVTLEDQVREVLRSPSEMGSSVEAAAARLARVPEERRAFASAFGDDPSPVTPTRLQLALAAYVRSLVALDSRFDRAVRGDTAALSHEERRGFALFMGKGGCGTCHFAPLFGGNTPPLYLNADVEVIGTAVSPEHPERLDADSGRARIDHLPVHVRAFKTPSLRNVTVTAPYMHHGAFATLDQVLRFYDGGGGQGAGAPLANQTLAADSLHLSAAERAAIIAFLGTLTDTAGVGIERRRVGAP